MSRILLALGLTAWLAVPAAAADTRPNILFIAVDDLRPEIGCYGVPHAITPNIDRLAAGGVRFDRAYVTYPLCLPSRASMLTGLRINYKEDGKKGRGFPELTQLGTTWPKTFRDAGYWTATSGKLYHGGVPKVDLKAWDVPGNFWHNGFKDWSPELMKKVVAEAGPKDVVAEFRKNGGGQGHPVAGHRRRRRRADRRANGLNCDQVPPGPPEGQAVRYLRGLRPPAHAVAGAQQVFRPLRQGRHQTAGRSRGEAARVAQGGPRCRRQQGRRQVERGRERRGGPRVDQGLSRQRELLRRTGRSAP